MDQALQRIFVDPGDFYTKAYVVNVAAGEYCGRTFFPSMAQRVAAPSGNTLLYHGEDGYYEIGYKGGSPFDLRFDADTAKLVTAKIVFDFCLAGKEDLELQFLVDDSPKLAIIEALVAELDGRRLEVAAARGNGRAFTRAATIKASILPAAAGALALLRRRCRPFTTGLVVDIGYHRLKVYVASASHGIEAFHSFETGIVSLYRSLALHLQHKSLADLDFFWLIKQIENTGDAVELTPGDDRYDYDISGICKDALWDLNKDFKTAVTDAINSYYNKETRWIDTLAIIGGGGALAGDLLVSSLAQDGYTFSDTIVERSPMYSLLNAVGSSQEESKVYEREDTRLCS